MTEPSPGTKTTAKLGVIGLPGKWSTDHLAGAVEKHTGSCVTVDLAHVDLNLEQGTCTYQGVDLCELDALLVKKLDLVYSPQNLDRIEILHYLEQRGVKLFPSPKKISRLINRLSCTVELRAAEVPMPATFVTEDPNHATRAILDFGAAVLKPLYSTKARGMRLIETNDEAAVRAVVDDFQAEGNRTVYVQKKVDMPDRDLGVVFLGTEYLTTYARVKSEDSWNTTTQDGGTYSKQEIDDRTLEVARRVRDIFDLEFTVVDVVLTADGPLVFEVSAFGGFRGILEGCGIDAAPMYVEHVLAKLG